jgi:MSHA biogenesis protein MshE
VIIDAGLLTEDRLSEALSRQLGVPYLDLKTVNPPLEVVHQIPEAQARRFRALAIEDFGARISVAMVDPTDLNAYDELSRLLGKELLLSVVAESELLDMFDRVYRRTEEISGLARELTADLAGLADVALDVNGLSGSSTGREDAPVVKLLQTVFEEAIKMRASDIHIEPQDDNLRIRFRIDGALYVQATADLKIASSVALRLKLISGLDIAEKRLPQDGRFNFLARGQSVDVRISTMPTQNGESVVMRLLNQSGGLLSLDRLGMSISVLEKLRHAIHRANGMVLVTGPTGSGKTTTLYAALAELNSTERKIITVEDPVEYRLPGINQVQVHEKIDLGFERVLRSALRQDPDVLLVGEMRDQITAEIGMRAAMTGHMVLSTLHTNDSISTPVRLIDMGIPRYMVAMSVQLVLAQRLVRLNCDACAEGTEPTPAQQAWLASEGVTKGRFRRGSGCVRCNSTGYLGRSGVYEVLEMSKSVVEALNDGDPNAFVRAARAQLGDATLQRDAARLAATGRTSIEEAMLVANEFID